MLPSQQEIQGLVSNCPCREGHGSMEMPPGQRGTALVTDRKWHLCLWCQTRHSMERACGSAAQGASPPAHLVPILWSLSATRKNRSPKGMSLLHLPKLWETGAYVEASPVLQLAAWETRQIQTLGFKSPNSQASLYQGVGNFPLWEAIWPHHRCDGRWRVQPVHWSRLPHEPCRNAHARTKPMDFLFHKWLTGQPSPSLFCCFLGTSLKLTSELMKPIINGRHGLPLIIFPGKVTQSSTLWNPANCIVCSQRGASSCRAPPGSGGGSCAITQQLEPPAGGKSSCKRGTHCQSLLATNIAYRSRLWLLAYPTPFRCGQPASPAVKAED